MNSQTLKKNVLGSCYCGGEADYTIMNCLMNEGYIVLCAKHYTNYMHYMNADYLNGISGYGRQL